MKFKDVKLSSRQLVLDIGSMRKFAKQLLNKGKPYDELLSALIAKNYYYDDDDPLPSVKEISQETGFKYDSVRKW